jgi:hypothetical protein
MDTDQSADARLDAVQAALGRLEVRHRRLSRAFFITCVLAGAAVVLGSTMPPKTIEAQRLVLRDSAGKERAVLEPTKQGCALVMRDFLGNKMASLETSAIGPMLIFKSDRGKEWARLQVAKGEPYLSLYDETNPRRRLTLLVHQDRSGILLTGPKEEDRVSLLDQRSGAGLRIGGQLATIK